MSDIFCKIIRKEIPSQIVMENEDWIAFHDIHPKAPVHVLIVPRKHIAGVADLEAEDVELAGRLLLATRLVAEKMGIAQSGFRVIISHGEHGGQEVPHLHLHVLGGKKL